MPTPLSAGAVGARLRHAESARRQHRHPLRRRRRRRHAAHRTEQYSGQLSHRLRLGGNVAAGSITTLIDRPLGVSGVTNPQAATGGQDAQSVDDIRANAPLSVLTLGRAVSITDYQNFAQSFRRHRQGLCDLDSQRTRPRRLPHRRRRGRIGAAARQSDTRQSHHGAAQLRQSADPDQRRFLSRDAVQLHRRHQVRPRL